MSSFMKKTAFITLIFSWLSGLAMTVQTSTLSLRSTSDLTKSYLTANLLETKLSENQEWTLSLETWEKIESLWIENGLTPRAYQSEKIKAILATQVPTEENELFILNQFHRSLIDLSTGQVDPQLTSSDIKFEQHAFSYTNLVSSSSPQTWTNLIQTIAPKNLFYVKNKSILQKLRALQVDRRWEKTMLPETTILKGTSHPIVLEIKEKLKMLGYSVQKMDNNFDEDLQSHLRTINLNLGFNYDGKISKTSSFWIVLNSDLNSRIREAELQLEKARWLPENMEDKFGYVNLSSQKFIVYTKINNEYTQDFESKIIVGQILRKTPSMKDKVISVILNPTWTVPLSIFFKDKLPILQKDFSYLSQKGFKVISLKTDAEIDPSTINWKKVTRSNIDFQLVQNPSYTNALGVVKFPMTNKYSIYLHDTNDRDLFAKENRHLSSGCVRLHKPIDFADYLLSATSWNRTRIENTVLKPGQTTDHSTFIKLSKPLDMYILSFTLDENKGALEFYSDFYGHNQAIHKKITLN